MTLDDLINIATIPEESEDSRFFESLPVIIRLRSASNKALANCPITGCAVEQTGQINSHKSYQLVLDIENPLE